MREHYDRETKKWYPSDEFYQLKASRAGESNRSELAFPMIISDQMDAIKHPATGLYSDSKSTFRRMTKASGCIEVGDQSPVVSRPNPIRSKEAKQDRVNHIKNAIGAL